VKILHSTHCKGPPLGCDRGYWVIFVIISVASLIESVIARYLAESQAAQTDAVHMALHGVLYGSFIFLSYYLRKQKTSPWRELTLRLRYAKMNIFILLAILTYIVFVDTIPRFWHPTRIVGKWMLIGASGGIIGTIMVLVILRIMEKGHKSSFQHEECALGKDIFHKVGIMDALTDLGISLSVFSTAVLIWINHELSFLDPYLTILIAAIITRQMKHIYRSIKLDEIHHLRHKH
jgi:Co/Zn/Cd efflux system component